MVKHIRLLRNENQFIHKKLLEMQHSMVELQVRQTQNEHGWRMSTRQYEGPGGQGDTPDFRYSYRHSYRNSHVNYAGLDSSRRNQSSSMLLARSFS